MLKARLKTMYRIGSRGAPEPSEPGPELADLPIKQKVPAYHQCSHFSAAKTDTGHVV